MTLTALGLDATAEAIYRALLAESYRDYAAVAAQVGVDPDEAVEALTCLEMLGLVADGGALGLWRPVPPVAGLTPLLERLRSEMARKREEADAAEAVAGQLMAEYPALDVRASSGQQW